MGVLAGYSLKKSNILTVGPLLPKQTQSRRSTRYTSMH